MNLQQFADLLRLLHPFCSKASDGASAELAYPFQLGDHIYATDRRLIVRVPAEPAYPLPSVLANPDYMQRRLDGMGPWPDPEVVPDDAWALTKPLPAMVTMACPDCGGVGLLDSNRVLCRTCTGSGLVERPQLVQQPIAGGRVVTFQSHHLRALLAFRPVRFLSDPEMPRTHRFYGARGASGFIMEQR